MDIVELKTDPILIACQSNLAVIQNKKP